MGAVAARLLLHLNSPWPCPFPVFSSWGSQSQRDVHHDPTVPIPSSSPSGQTDQSRHPSSAAISINHPNRPAYSDPFSFLPSPPSISAHLLGQKGPVLDGHEVELGGAPGAIGNQPLARGSGERLGRTSSWAHWVVSGEIRLQFSLRIVGNFR